VTLSSGFKRVVLVKNGLGRMRNALKIIAFVGVLSVVGFEQSKAADAPLPIIPSSIYAVPVDDKAGIPRADEPGLLPLRASDRVQLPVMEFSDRAAVPQATVEAIPTPTAFHAGGTMLVGILLFRVLRKLRWA
jgi:hypothetical protein